MDLKNKSKSNKPYTDYDLLEWTNIDDSEYELEQEDIE